MQQQQQQQPPPPQSLLLDFQAGVTATLRSWSALRTAVESGWGGGERESQQKAEVLRQHIFDLLLLKNGSSNNVEVFDLADNLAIYLEEEFSVTLEDNSEQQVAETIFRLYEECRNGNSALAQQLVSHAEGAVKVISQLPVQIQTTEHDDDDEDGDAMMNAGSDTTKKPAPSLEAAMQQEAPLPLNAIPADYLQRPLFGKALPQKPAVPAGPVRQLGESIPEEKTVEMDDDGFAPVAAKGRRRR